MKTRALPLARSLEAGPPWMTSSKAAGTPRRWTDSAALRSDAEVIALSLEEPEAFGLIFDRHFNDIFRYVARRLGRQAAEELAAEVFLVAFSRRQRYDTNRADARPWLFGIASRLACNQRRRELRMWAAYNRVIAMSRSEAGDSDPGDALISKQVLAALVSLSKEVRETVLLYAWADLSYEQLAEALEVPVGTIRSRLNRARGQFQRALQEKGASDG